MIRRLFVLTALLLPLLWVGLMTVPAALFLKHLENKYSIVLTGQKKFAWFQPRVKISRASFRWNEKVELREGDFELAVDPWVWVRSRLWEVSLQGDGARLRFLGGWLRKTNVEEIQATRLRLKLRFSHEGIQDIDTVDIVAPNYLLQIHSRMEKKP